MQATTTFQTQHATRHLAALCRHFGNKVTATFNDTRGHVEFPFGHCDLTADDARLMLNTSASDPDQLDLLIDIITRHLERFAFRENPDLVWDIPSQAQSLTSSKETQG